MALPPPAVFSTSSGTANPPASACRVKVLRQLSTPAAGSSFARTCPPCTTRPSAPTAAAASACWPSSLRLGMRIRLFVVATLSTYGAWTTTVTSPVAQGLGVRPRQRRLPALRIGEEDLHAVGVHLRGAGDRPAVEQLVVLGQAGADVYADRVGRHGRDSSSGLRRVRA